MNRLMDTEIFLIESSHENHSWNFHVLELYFLESFYQFSGFHCHLESDNQIPILLHLALDPLLKLGELHVSLHPPSNIRTYA